MSEENIKDPCGEFGPTQFWAVVWTVCVIAIGSFMTYKLACIDSRQYETKGEYLNIPALKQNRRATTSIASERVDSRQKASYTSIQNSLSN